MTDKEALKLALEALEYIDDGANNQGTHTGISWRCVSTKAESAIAALKERLAQSEQEPVAWMYESVCGNDFAIRHNPPSYAKNIRPLYTTPQQRTWVGLTEQEHTDIAVECGCMSADWVFYGAAVERKVKERNT